MMTMSAEQCALYAQVIPVFVLIILAESVLWKPDPKASRRFNPMLVFSAVFVLGCIGTYLALISADGGAGPLMTAIIRGCASATIGVAATFGAIRPFVDRGGRDQEDKRDD